MLKIADIGSYTHNKIKVNFCIEDLNNIEISAYVSVFSQDCNCRATTTTECHCTVLNTAFVIPMNSFRSVGNNAVAYAAEHLNNVYNREQYSDEIIFDLNGFMEAMQVLNLPELTTSMLSNLPPKQLVYDYIVKLIDTRMYWKHFKDYDYDNFESLAEIRDQYLWILTDKEFDEEKVNTLNESFKISLVQIIQDAENAYNELYGILSEYEHPNGLLK